MVLPSYPYLPPPPWLIIFYYGFFCLLGVSSFIAEHRGIKHKREGVLREGVLREEGGGPRDRSWARNRRGGPG